MRLKMFGSKSRGGVSLLELMIVGLLLATITVTISYVLVPMLARSQAEQNILLMSSDIQAFQTILTSDLRTSKNNVEGQTITLNQPGDSFVLDTSRGYVRYVLDSSEQGGFSIKRVATDGTQILIRGGIVEDNGVVYKYEDKLHSVSFYVDMIFGVKEIVTKVWSRF